MSHHSITFDIDWAPDFVILSIAQQLEKTRTPSTWFVTHECEALDYLRSKPDLFELGIHPNFRPNSSHGSTPLEVLEYCLKIAPQATSMRTHGLIQSISMYDDILAHTNIRLDLTTYLPRSTSTEPLTYERHNKQILRGSTYWQDELELSRSSPILHPTELPSGTGLRVYNFHPILVYLNAVDTSVFSKLLKLVPDLVNAPQDIVDSFIFQKRGIRTFLTDLTSSPFSFIRASDWLSL